MDKWMNEIKNYLRKIPSFFFMSFEAKKERIRVAQGTGSHFLRSSANTQRSRMCAQNPSYGRESRQEIKQLHPSYLLNNFSLENTSMWGQSCHESSNSERESSSHFIPLRPCFPHSRLACLVFVSQTHWAFWCFPASPMAVTSFSNSAADSSHTFLRKVIAQLWPLDRGLLWSSSVKSPSKDSP